ncbi:MAG: nucleotidyltransferase family protein [Barnesiella sp.]
MKEKGLITAYKNRAKELLPILLVSVLWDKPVDENHFMDMNDNLWNEIISISGQHGVLALAFDAMLTLPTELQPSRIIRLQWFNMVCQVENFNERIYRVIFLLDKLFTDAHIPYMLLKGIGIASYYPVPEHRSSGDIDIFVPENAEKAIKIIKNAGAVPDHDTKRHCCLFINGVTVEIHRYCIGQRQNVRQTLPNHKQTVIKISPTSYSSARPCNSCSANNV